MFEEGKKVCRGTWGRNGKDVMETISTNEKHRGLNKGKINQEPYIDVNGKQGKGNLEPFGRNPRSLGKTEYPIGTETYSSIQAFAS